VEELKRPEHHPVYVYMGNARVEGCAQLVGKGGIAWTAADSLESMIKKADDVASKATTATQQSLFDYMEEISKSDVETIKKVSEPVAPYIAEKEVDIYSALVSVVVVALAKKSFTEKALRKVIDPIGYLSPKGWKLFIEKACAEGKIACREKAKKRGKPDTCYYLP
jgi:hypothetical protein